MEEKGFEDFLSSGRTGRRNAMHDISDEKAASVTTAQLPLDMAKLSCAGRLYIPELSCAGRLYIADLSCAGRLHVANPSCADGLYMAELSCAGRLYRAQLLCANRFLRVHGSASVC